MQFAPLLFALVFALTASLPCAPDTVQPAHSGADGGGHTHAAIASEDTPPCHAAPKAASLSAPCPCGCGARAPANVSVGSLGVALLPADSPTPEPREFAVTRAPAARFASAPARAIDKVPRSA